MDKALPDAGKKLVDLPDLDGRTPLSWATVHGAQMVATLIEAGAEVDTQDTNGRTPLSWAASYGAADSVEELLGHGAQVNLADHNGRTALSWALDDSILPTTNGDNNTSLAPEHGPPTTQPSAIDKALPLLRVLLDNGADVYSEKILVNALMTHKPGVIDEIFRKVSLHRAIESGMSNVVIHFFLDDRLKHVYPTLISDRDFKRRTLLHVAAEYGCRPIVKELLNRSAEIDATDVYSVTPLKQAIRGGKVASVEALLSNGAEVADISGQDWQEFLRACNIRDGILVLT
ncbi:ankyrin repeat domain-containing protein, partial [Candidatus Bathyarchaeota archaeon]|nr:ankyrin repeat domain-containing protein [Candidatus Bathyarchaeota archaeon]